MTFRLGAKSGAKVCRYERFAPQPGLAAVFAFEVIFRTPARELFSGLYAMAEHDVMVRARLLLLKLAKEKLGSTTHRKLDAVTAIVVPATPGASGIP